MKTLLTILCLLPTLCFGQGFGSFKNDQPFLAKSGNGIDTNLYDYVLFDINALALSDGDSVEVCTDFGINHYDMLQEDAGLQPYWTNNASEINNQGYLYFDGADDYMVTNVGASIPQLHSFLVAQLPSSAGTAKTIFHLGTPGFFQYEDKMQMSSVAYLGISNSITAWTLFEFCWDGSQSFWRTNGVLARWGFTTTNSAMNNVQLGGIAAPSQIKVAYWSVYTNHLSEEQATTISDGLASRYGISIGARDEVPTWYPLTNSHTLASYDTGLINMGSNGVALASIPDFGPYAYNLRCTNNTGTGPHYGSSTVTNYGEPHIDFAYNSGEMAGTNFATSYPQPTTIIMVGVGKYSASAATWFMFDNCNAPGDASNAQRVNSGSGLAVMEAGTVLSQADTFMDNYAIHEMEFNGASSKYRTNNVVAMSGNAGSNERKGILIGGSRNWNLANDMAIVCYYLGVYTNTLDATTRSNIYYYLGNRYHIPISSYAP